MSSFEYHRPRTLKEAFELVRRTPEARFIAGGTDVMVRIRAGRMTPPALVSLRNVTELGGVEVDAHGTLRVGGGAPLADVLASRAVRERAPVLAVAVESMGSAQIRSVATLGGNVCNASPCADSAPALLVLGARVRLEGPEGAREIPLDELFTGPGATTLRPAEVVTGFLFDPPSPAARGVFLKKSRVSMDLAIANVAVLLEVEGGTCRRARVAAGAAAPVPLRLRPVEILLEGARITPQVAEEAGKLAMDAVSPITDIRGSADYRRAIVGAYVKRAVVTCASRSTP